MPFEKKSGRTPEQQAARNARKAAKFAQIAEADQKALQAGATSASATAAAPAPVKVEELGEVLPVAESSTSGSKKRARKDVEEAGGEEELQIDLAAPTPLSKAELRAQKKRVKRGDPEPEAKPASNSESKKKVNSGDDEGAPEKVKVEKKNSVWIGNLSFRTTQERLKEWFEKGVSELGGDDDSVTRINLPKEKIKGKGEFANNKGFAYVDFASPENQKLAVQLSEKLLEGRKVLIKLGDDYAAKADARTPKPVKIKGADPQPHAESSTLFVGNLSFETTEEGLRDFIESHATPKGGEGEGEGESEADDEKDGAAATRGGKNSGLRKVRLGAFEDTGRCKGFAFLDFFTPQDATAALTNRANKFYAGRRLILQYASEEASKRSGSQRNQSAPRAGTRAPRPARQPQSHSQVEGAVLEDGAALATGEEKKKDTRGKKWETTGRAAPGAALAAAKRENVAIVAGEGTKITFD